MKQSDVDTPEIQFEPGISTLKPNLSQIFAERSSTFLNELMLFAVYFNSIPNLINEIDIDCRKASLWFGKSYKNDIKDWHFCKKFLYKSKKAEYDEIFYILFEDLIVNFDTNYVTV